VLGFGAHRELDQAVQRILSRSGPYEYSNGTIRRTNVMNKPFPGAELEDELESVTIESPRESPRRDSRLNTRGHMAPSSVGQSERFRVARDATRKSLAAQHEKEKPSVPKRNVNTTVRATKCTEVQRR